MDALKAEIALKRKDISSPISANDRPNKYMRRGDVEKARLEKERQEEEEKARAKLATKAAAAATQSKVSPILVSFSSNESHFELENRPLEPTLLNMQSLRLPCLKGMESTHQ